jgi:cytidine deaminase
VKDLSSENSSDENRSEAIEAARRAHEGAHALYSNFRVGAAVEAEDGRIFAAGNVESAVYSATMCAERIAVWKAISEGARRFRRVAVVADTESLTPPCGACRQILWEFCGDVELILANLRGESLTLRMSELLPRPFGDGFLGEAAAGERTHTSGPTRK